MATLLDADVAPVALDDSVVADLQPAADAFFAAGFIPNEVDITSIIDDRYSELTPAG